MRPSTAEAAADKLASTPQPSMRPSTSEAEADKLAPTPQPGSLKRVPSSPNRIAKIAAVPERHGSHSLERIGEALDAAVSFVQAFIHLVWAKRGVFYVVLMRVFRLLLFVVLLLPGWIPGTLHYLRGAGVRRGVRYGPRCAGGAAASSCSYIDTLCCCQFEAQTRPLRAEPGPVPAPRQRVPDCLFCLRGCLDDRLPHVGFPIRLGAAA